MLRVFWSYIKNMAFCNIYKIGFAVLFFIRVLRAGLPKRNAISAIITNLYQLGSLSLSIMVVSSLFIGMILALQGYAVLSKVGAEGMLGSMVALTMVRELGPVVSALLFCGRACSSLTAEIGLMKATDQISSMEMMGIDPVKIIVTPKFWAGIIVLPILNLIFLVVSIYGAFFISVHHFNIDPGSFFVGMQPLISLKVDVLQSIIKSIVFAVILVWIAVYKGFYCSESAEGLSIATTSTVVVGSLSIFIIDFIMTSLMTGAIL